MTTMRLVSLVLLLLCLGDTHGNNSTPERIPFDGQNAAPGTSTTYLRKERTPERASPLFQPKDVDDAGVAASSIQQPHDRVSRNVQLVSSTPQTRTVLVILVSGSQIGSPKVSADELYRRIFADTNSLKQQMARCSAGQVQLNPTNYGIINVQVPDVVSMTTTRAKIVELAQAKALQSINGNAKNGNANSNVVTNIRNVAHHTMFVLPNRHDDFVASAEICPNQQACTSTYSDASAASLSVLLHEFGHNLSLNHARGNNGGVEMYADQTGNMGHSMPDIGGPLSCYNAANHWALTWYGDRRLDLEPPSTPVQLYIAAFVDYGRIGQVASSTSSSNPLVVLVKLGATNLYMQFNRAKDYNAGTRDMPNKLVVTRRRSGTNGNTNAGTELVAGLDATTTTASNRSYRDGSVAIEVCSVITDGAGVDIMVVSIGASSTDCTNYAVAAAASAASSNNSGMGANVPPSKPNPIVTANGSSRTNNNPPTPAAAPSKTSWWSPNRNSDNRGGKSPVTTGSSQNGQSRPNNWW